MQTKKEKVLELYNKNNIRDIETIAEKAGCHIVYVRKILRGRNIFYKKKKIFSIKYSEDELKSFIKYHKAGLKPFEIEEITGRSASFIRKSLNENGFKTLGMSESRIRFKKTNIFKNVNNQDSMYFLGLMYADGNVSSKRNGVSISMVETEKNILEYFSNKIFGFSKLVERKKKESRHQRSYGIAFYDSEIHKSLCDLGCVPQKSLTLDFPDTLSKNKHFSHFVRGYFDGDGSVSKNAYSVSFVGSEWFINGLSDFLVSMGIKNSVYDHFNTKKLCITSQYMIKKLYNFLYKDFNICCERKRERMSKIKPKLTPILISPKGELIEVNNISSFCRENEISTYYFYRLLKGKITEHNGWKLNR